MNFDKPMGEYRNMKHFFVLCDGRLFSRYTDIVVNLLANSLLTIGKPSCNRLYYPFRGLPFVIRLFRVQSLRACHHFMRMSLHKAHFALYRAHLCLIVKQGYFSARVHGSNTRTAYMLSVPSTESPDNFPCPAGRQSLDNAIISLAIVIVYVRITTFSDVFPCFYGFFSVFLCFSHFFAFF